MKQVLTIALSILGSLAVAGFFLAMMAAPGFLSSQASTIELATVAEVISR